MHIIPINESSHVQDTPLKSIQKPVERQSYERDDFSPLPPRSSRRRGKENFDDMEDSFEIRAPRRRAPNKTDSYEDLLRRKRAEERRYRSRFEEQDFDDDLRHMRLSSKNYKFNSKSDGFLSRRHYDDDDLDDEDPYGPRSRRSRRVRFTDDDDMDDSQWLRRRRLQDLDDEYDEDFEDLREQSRRRRQKSRVSQRISSAHEGRRAAAPEVETDMRRTKTDSELRSASAPLSEGTGIIGGREEPKALKLQEKERYRKELEKQRQEQEDKKKQERMERLGIGMESSPFTSQSSRPQEPKQQPPPGRQSLYSPPPSTYIPSSHPPPHPAVQPNPYDDPYFYYGGQERAAPQPSSVTVPPLGVGFASTFGNRYDRGIQQELTPRGRAPPSDPSPPETQAYQSAYEGDPHHQPPGGFSNIGRDDSSDSQKKRATQQALRDELERQMKEHAQKKEKEKIEKESQWLRRRRLQDLDDEYDEDFEDLREQSRRRRQKSRVSQRISSAHEGRRAAAPEVETDMRRTKTDSELRSASAPLSEGTGIIGGREEPKALKLQEKERYRKELEKQRQEQEDKKKQERMERLGIGMESSPFTSQSSRPQEPKQQPPPGRQSLYSPPPSTYIPSSHPPPHPAVQPNPYDDPYFYYGGQERAAPQPSSVTVPPLGVGFASAFGNRYEGGIQQELTPRGRAPPSDPSPPETQAYQSAYEGDPHHQPPGGFSNIGRDDSSDSQKKRATQQALRDELERQMKEHAQKKEKEKIEKERYERKMEAEIEAYNPWGKGGGGAPLRDQTGHLVTDLKKMHQYNQEGKIVSPRDPPPAKDIRFELPPEVNKISPEPAYPDQSGGDMGRTSSFGRSDPLKTKQPQDDIKMKAKLEYQLYLKQQKDLWLGKTQFFTFYNLELGALNSYFLVSFLASAKVEEKERKKKEEQEKIKREEELEEQRLEEQRIKMQKEFEEEQEKARRKEEEVRKRNEEMKAAQKAKKKQEDRRRKEMDEEREAELARKLDAEIAAKKAAGAMAARSSSPPIPTLRAKQEAADYTDASRIASPPIPTLANQRRHESPVPVSKPVYQEQGPSSRLDNDSDVLSQLTALRKQLKNEENKIQSQIGRMDATTKYQQIGQRRETDSRRSRREVDVFDRVRLSNKPGPPPLTTRRNGETSNNAAAEEFNKIKYEETSSLAGEFRSRFPQPAQTDSVLDLQQQEYLREQEDKISSLKAGFARSRPFGLNAQGPIRSKSKESLLDSESQFIAVDGPAADLPSLSQVDLRPRQSSARQRRRWKELEERAKEPNPYNAYKPPTPGGFSLNSVTSFNVDEVATKNDERLRRLDSIRRADAGDPEQVLQQFMNEHRRPLTRTSETSLEAETSFEPLPF
ncbi:predicted protein [Nematostella vectensis]|uniref:Centrosome and spindle pole-associated protein 1 C-terminal domain-containing protein n=1 Tax=Nematostella vectensis TaxID=45351 RepID=A7S9G9_NEMVE|nr:predicted protein [Nematostella vectensis]|eukprot:XP_001631766.1 predicted protein [Nematostella vectensis]